jgi:hemolysin III
MRPAYSRAEYVSDAVVHVAGLAVVLGAVPALIVLTASVRGDFAAMVGTSVYGVTLVLMILCSAIYNMVGEGRWIWLLRRLDHSAIYLKIAGTYTPFALLTGHGAALTLGIWAAATAGVGLKLFSPERFRWLALSLYLGMGWAGVLAGGELFAAVPGAVIVLMLIGGGLYTFGVVFHLWDRLPFHNTIWHLFVLAASIVFYVAVTVQVLAAT